MGLLQTPRSIRKIHNIIRGSLSQGQKWGWVSTTVAAQATPPAIPRPLIATPAPADVGRLIVVARDVDPEMAVYLRLAAVTGARPGEVCGLRQSDIDFAAGQRPRLDLRDVPRRRSFIFTDTINGLGLGAYARARRSADREPPT